MAIVRVQGNARGTSTTDTITVVQASAPTNGNVNVATIGCADSGAATKVVSSISQTNVVWTSQITKTGAFGQIGSEIWFGVVGAGASDTITVNLSGDSDLGATADVCEYSGILTAGFLDKTASSSGGAGTVTNTGTTAATTQADELWVGVVNARYESQSTPTNGFTLMDGTETNNLSIVFLEKIVSAIGAANSGTTASANCYWCGCIATFKAEAVAAGFPPVFQLKARGGDAMSKIWFQRALKLGT